MADIYLDTLNYYKTEIDDINAAETIRVDNLLATKVGVASLGSPSGTATLDSSGTQAVVEIPFSDHTTVMDNTNEVTVVNPKQLDFAFQQLFGHTFDYTILTDIVVTNNVYEDVCTLLTESRVAGVYKVTLSKLHTINSVTNSAYFNVSTDGGLTWEEIRVGSTSVTDVIPSTLTFPYVHAGGIASFIVQSRKELDSDILLIKKITIMFESKDI